jgi:hypothetical protein
VLSEVACLADPPCETAEPALWQLGLALERVVKAAYTSVCEDKINAFAQRQINSFILQRPMYSKPLMVKLQEGTYRRYIHIWKRLLCYAFRLSADTTLALGSQLTGPQTALLDRALVIATERVAKTDSRG